jgi:hypothetical protein
MSIKDLLNTLRDQSYTISKSKGWHEDATLYLQFSTWLEEIKVSSFTHILRGDLLEKIKVRLGKNTQGVPVMEKLMLIVTELAEAAEDYRESKEPLNLLYYVNDRGEKVPMTIQDAAAGKKTRRLSQ